MRSNRTDLLQRCVERGGLRYGRRCAQFIGEWELAVRSAGGPITIDDFARYWRDGRSTAYRRLGEFRAIFPELGAHGVPHDLMGPLLRRLAAGDLVGDQRYLVPA